MTGPVRRMVLFLSFTLLQVKGWFFIARSVAKVNVGCDESHHYVIPDLIRNPGKNSYGAAIPQFYTFHFELCVCLSFLSIACFPSSVFSTPVSSNEPRATNQARPSCRGLAAAGEAFHQRNTRYASRLCTLNAVFFPCSSRQKKYNYTCPARNRRMP